MRLLPIRLFIQGRSPTDRGANLPRLPQPDIPLFRRRRHPAAPRGLTALRPAVLFLATETGCPVQSRPSVRYMAAMSETKTLPSIESIREDFAFLDDWEDRYRYVIELGRDLPKISDDEHNDANKVQGCVSQVWLVTDAATGADPVITLRADSDAHIVRGLVAIMIALHSGKHASEILATDAEGTLRDLGLDEHLTPQRANGVRAMIQRIRREAESRLHG